MDPSPFLRIIVANLAIRNPTTVQQTSYYCKVKFRDFPHQTCPLHVINTDTPHPDQTTTHTVSACFTLPKSEITHILSLKKHPNKPNPTKFSTAVKLEVFQGQPGGSVCGFRREKLVGKVTLPVELTSQVIEGKTSAVVQNGWVLVGGVQVYVSVKAQPDPRFVFEFDNEPECSPQVFQTQGNFRQPVFSCKFGCRNSGDRNSSTMSEPSTSKSWLSSFKHHHDKDHNHNQAIKERKGWSLTVHDLSGSPVAAASMVTPFVPSQGSDRVSRSNPGAWLILRPGDGTWKPWGRLEAWRDSSDALGYRFELLPDAAGPLSMGPSAGITLAQDKVSTKTGGKFCIDISNGPSPAGSPNSSFDFGSWSGSGSAGSSVGSEFGAGSGWWPGFMYKGFVMSSTVGGEGKPTKPVVEVGSQHVTCTEDAAAFVALAAALDLSMDACRPFSQKLRKELRQLSGEFII